MNNENKANETTNINDLPGKIVRSSAIANELLNQGHRMIGLKPRRDNRHEYVDENGVKTVVIDNSSVYVFYKDVEMLEALDKLKARRRRMRSERRNAEVDEGPQMED